MGAIQTIPIHSLKIREVTMKYTESDKEAIEAILYYQYRIDKAMQELLQRHTLKAIREKLKYMREKREKREKV
jgi:hypothetical protein